MTSSQQPKYQGDKRSRENANLARVDNVLNSLVAKLGLENKLREQTLTDFWPAVVGEFFASRTRCLFIDNENQLVVAVANAQVAAELALRKKEIVSQLQNSAAALGVTVTGLRLDMKRFHRKPEAFEAPDPVEPILPEPTDEDLKLISLSPTELAQIGELAKQLEAQNCEQATRGRIIAMLENNFRLSAWQKANGYPLCSRCNSPSARLHGQFALCANCFIG